MVGPSQGCLGLTPPRTKHMSNKPKLQQEMWQAIHGLASGASHEAPEHLASLKAILGVGPNPSPDAEPGWECVLGEVAVDVNELNEQGLRSLDLLATGRDSQESCYAALFLVQAGFAINEQPNASDAPPAYAAAFSGNWQILDTLIELGAEVREKVTAMRQNLLGGTAIHALASGFRAARGEDYGQCFAALLGAGADINAKDRKRQTPIDIAMRSAANTGNHSLVDAMLEYGVDVDHETYRQTSAASMASAITRRTGDAMIIAQMSKAALQNIARSREALQAIAEFESTSGPRP